MVAARLRATLVSLALASALLAGDTSSANEARDISERLKQIFESN